MVLCLMFPSRFESYRLRHIDLTRSVRSSVVTGRHFAERRQTQESITLGMNPRLPTLPACHLCVGTTEGTERISGRSFPLLSVPKLTAK